MNVTINQIWQRKADEVLVAIRQRPTQHGYSSHLYAQNLNTGRHFDVSIATLGARYELVGYDASPPESVQTDD